MASAPSRIARHTFFPSPPGGGQVTMRSQHFRQLDEGLHDSNVHLHSALAPQDARKHRHALLGKGKGTIPPPSPAFC